MARESRPPKRLIAVVLVVYSLLAGGGIALILMGQNLVGEALFILSVPIGPAWFFWTRRRYFR